MANYKVIAERMVEEEFWTHEGDTQDGTGLVSCPSCGAAVPRYLKLKHAYFHARLENNSEPAEACHGPVA